MYIHLIKNQYPYIPLPYRCPIKKCDHIGTTHIPDYHDNDFHIYSLSQFCCESVTHHNMKWVDVEPETKSWFDMQMLLQYLIPLMKTVYMTVNILTHKVLFCFT